jgi:hypothetical protein
LIYLKKQKYKENVIALMKRNLPKKYLSLQKKNVIFKPNGREKIHIIV